MDIKKFLLGFDRAVNGLLGGDPRETISSRMGRYTHLKGWAYLGCKFLNLWFWENDHCEKARTEHENLDSNDHPIIFFVLFVGIVLITVYGIMQIVDKFI